MTTMTVDEWQQEGARRFGPDQRDWKFVCPMCKTAQSARDFYAAGLKPGTGEVNKYLGFSCIGRWTNAGPPDRAKPGHGCNWSLGGLFQTHELEVIDAENKRHPRFVFAEIAPADVAAVAMTEELAKRQGDICRE